MTFSPNYDETTLNIRSPSFVKEYLIINKRGPMDISASRLN
jgi:hypothetical protein